MRKNQKRRSVIKLKLKNSTRAFFTIIALVLFVVSACMIYVNVFAPKEIKSKKNVYDYKNSYNLDYVVNIKKNSFIEEDSLPKDKTYVSDLIESIATHINYEYNSSADSTIAYDYRVEAIMGSSYTQDGEAYEIWTKTDVLKDVKEQQAIGNIKLNEDIQIDYQEYHKEVKQFEQTMGMSIDAKLYIKLIVDTNTTVNNKEVSNQYISNFSITIGDKIATVEGKTSDSNSKSITDDVVVVEETNKFLIAINVVLLCISAYVIYYIRFKTYTGYSVRNEFKLELNRILKSCQDRIVVVKNRLDIEQENTIEVKDFGELIKLSEELFKPILYWMSEDSEEAYFSVISNKMNYRFVLRK